MRVLVPVFAGIAVVAGVVSGILWNELRTERQTNEDLRTQLAAARISRGMPSAPSMAAAPQAATAAADNPAQTPTPDSQQPKASEAQIRAASTALSSALTLATSLTGATGDADLMKDPEFRKARLTQMRLQVERSYPGLAEELGLSEKEANQLFELIAENQLKSTTDLTASARGANGNLDVAALLQRQQGAQKEQEEAIRTMLGNGKYTQWQAYQETRPARTQVTTMGSTLSAAGQPLTSAQTRALTTAMINRQQQQRLQPPPPLAQNINTADPQARAAQMLEQSQRRQEENNRQTLEAVAPHLNATQLATLRQQYEQQDAQRRESLSRTRETLSRLQITLPQPAGAQQAAPARP